MCGIFGTVGRFDHSGLREAALTLKHRGPDGFGEWASGDRMTYLAHCRLAIIDLSDAGRQPMGNEDGSVQLTFNGEIYNFQELRRELETAGHRFASHSDSEVIVHGYEEWGDDVVGRLRGIFAFGLWDERRKRLLLARDHLGVKPLYYAIRGAELAFASEPRALLTAMPFLREVDPSAVAQLLRHSFISGSQGVWRGVGRLPPATILAFSATTGSVAIRRYWAPPEVDRGLHATAAAEELERLLRGAVGEELIADVPVGCFLSGGLDSSMVTSFAAEREPGIRTYFADFPEWDGSERADAALAAAHLGTDHHVVAIGELAAQDDLGGRGESVFDAFDEPIGDLSIVPTWHLAKAMRRHVKVALSGDGGDELFAGYRRYEAMHVISPRRRVAWLAERLRRRLGFGRQWPQGCASPEEYFRFLMCPGFSTHELCALFPEWRDTMQESEMGIALQLDRSSPRTRALQEFDLNAYLVDNNLHRMDRCSMAHGLEVRVPILDHRVVELALSLPGGLNPPTGGGKLLLRGIAGRRLPQQLLTKPKQGFSFPRDRFVGVETMAHALLEGALAGNGLLDRSVCANWLAEKSGGNFEIKLWLLFVLEQWARRWLFPQWTRIA